MSSIGFAEVATKKAEASGIRCINLKAAASKSWIIGSSIDVWNRHIDHVSIRAVVPNGITDLLSGDLKIIEEDGESISSEMLRKKVLDAFEREEWKPVKGKSLEHTIVFEDPTVSIVDQANTAQRQSFVCTISNCRHRTKRVDAGQSAR